MRQVLPMTAAPDPRTPDAASGEGNIRLPQQCRCSVDEECPRCEPPVRHQPDAPTREPVSAGEVFRDELDDHIAESMRDPVGLIPTPPVEASGEDRLRGSDLVLREQVAKQAAIIGATWDVINDYRGTKSRTARRLRREVRAALRGETEEGRT